MEQILVSGLLNTETTVQVERFPIEYCPIHFPFFGIDATVSGVGFNVAKALRTLGDSVTLFSLTGRDQAGQAILQAVQEAGLETAYIRPALALSPQTVVLYDKSGKRQIYCDLKDIQQAVCDPALFTKALTGCKTTVLCNINFNRPLLSVAKKAGVLIATDVHVLSDLHDAFNADFMHSADVLFLSDEAIPGEVSDFVKALAGVYCCKVIAVGLGHKGALLYTRENRQCIHIPAVYTRPVVNTVGAGDALFSAFMHFYTKTNDALFSLRRAVYFASYKIGEAGAANGFTDETALDALINA